VPPDPEEALSGGSQTEVRRAGEVVYRSAKPQSRTVVAFLRHLSDAGFTAAPVPIGDGFSPDGREQFGFIAGHSPQPRAWSDEATWEVGRLLRHLHTLSASFRAPEDAVWHPWFARSLSGGEQVIGHGDLGPWNILAVDGLPVAFIDWDNAGPVDPIWELAMVAWLNAQWHDDDVALLNGLPDLPRRAHQLALMLDHRNILETALAQPL
jgi:aminoglycoside phosphotransferase (APT) family kinase protein